MIEQMSNRIDKWASSWENLSSGVCDQVRLKPKFCVMISNIYRIKQLLTFVSVNMKCYWTVNNSYWPPLRVSQYEVNTSWPLQQKSIVLKYWKQKINSFSYAEKKSWHMCANFWINPHNGKLPSRLAPAQCQNSLAPQLLSNNCWSKTKTSISLNRVYWYDIMSYLFLLSNIYSTVNHGKECVSPFA